jgi:hypothetical protein
LIVAEKSATFKGVATKDSHLDCRAPLILIVALQARKAATRLMHTGGHKQGLRWVRKLRTWPGRLIRDSERKIVQDCQ